VRILRFFAVVAAVTLLGGAFGATVGGLFGFALPKEIRLSTRMETKESAQDPGEALRETTRGKAYEVGMGPESETSPARKGAALGGALGLTMGAVLGFLLGILDQILLRVVEWYGRRRETGPPA
jgi:hypothetical protein